MTRELTYGHFSETCKDDDAPPISDATETIEGVTRMSAQEHFYLETNASLIIPSREDGEMECFMSTQHPSECQHMIAHILGIQSNKVTIRVCIVSIIYCQVKRMGGGFGGKETRALFLGAGMAVAARKLGVPVRCMLSREEDMAMVTNSFSYIV